MPRHIVAVAAIAVLLGGLAPAQAGIVVTVDKTTQRLSVVVDGAPRYQWPVSTARWGYRTTRSGRSPVTTMVVSPTRSFTSANSSAAFCGCRRMQPCEAGRPRREIS